MGIRVLGTGSYTPAFQVTNEDMAKIVETNDEWIRTRTGIGTRHISDGEPTWYMGAEAAKRHCCGRHRSAGDRSADRHHHYTGVLHPVYVLHHSAGNRCSQCGML